MFPAGAINGSTQCIDITITDDDVFEGDETFTVTIYPDVTEGNIKTTVTIHSLYIIAVGGGEGG